MKTAITVWNNRIAPVFDEAGKCLILGEDNEASVIVALPEDYSAKAVFLKEQGIDTLICGGISCECERLILDKGITIIPFIAGNIDEVISAWKENRLIQAKFGMPGCGCPRRRRLRAGRGGRGGHSSLLRM
jgi:predicted Fe-Mo cluster-binding NifX family protein